MTAHFDAFKARAKELGFVYRDDRSCPRMLVGGRHKRGDCWCECRYNDHGYRYRLPKEDNKSVIMWEPYGISDLSELAYIRKAANSEGINLSISGRSPWFPGHTLALIFEKDEP